MFSCMILLEIFSGPRSCDSLPSSIPIILRLDLFIVFQMFCVRKFLALTFSLTDVSIYSIVSSLPEMFSSISCILLAMIVPTVNCSLL